MTTDAIKDIIKMLEDRRTLGLQLYGKVVSSENSNNWFQEWLEECLDSLPYALAARDRQRLLEERVTELESQCQQLEERASKAEAVVELSRDSVN